MVETGHSYVVVLVYLLIRQLHLGYLLMLLVIELRRLVALINRSDVLSYSWRELSLIRVVLHLHLSALTQIEVILLLCATDVALERKQIVGRSEVDLTFFEL